MQHFKVVILGGGSGGLTVAARLTEYVSPQEIAIVEPNREHYYQPGWTMVGGGIFTKAETVRLEQDLIPKGCRWLEDAVAKVIPDKNQVTLKSGESIGYDFLVVATGLKLDWHKIKGLQGHLGQNGIYTIYEFDQVEKVYPALRDFQGGTAIFVMPPVPIKCAGAPQKILYLADEIFRENGVREKSRVIFANAGGAIFGIPSFAESLNKVIARKKIEHLTSRKLVEVKPDQKIAVFEHKITTTNPSGQVDTRVENEEIKYDLIHVVPTMSTHTYVAESGLAFTTGPQKDWLKVDKHTLQHCDFPNIFGIGDVTGVPNSKTAAAIRKQAPVVVQNLTQAMKAQPLTEHYDGYSSCPLVTGKGKVILAEFGYDGKLMPTFPVDQTKERRSMWLLKKYILPRLYWQGMLKGRA